MAYFANAISCIKGAINSSTEQSFLIFQKKWQLLKAAIFRFRPLALGLTLKTDRKYPLS